jgi:hypothetical protein
MNKMAPRNITTNEFRAFVNLFEKQKHDAATVGAMLSAYGSCRDIRASDPIDLQENSDRSKGEE